MTPDVHIGMVTCNRLAFTRQAIFSIWAFAGLPFTLTVVDNGSSDGTREFLQDLVAHGMLYSLHLLPENVGVARAANLAWRQRPQAGYFLKYDNDIVMWKSGWLRRMVRVADLPEVGAVAYNFEPRLYPRAVLSGRTVRFTTGTLGGACFLVPQRIRRSFGDWCEEFGLYGEEDMDYCLRLARAGFLTVYMNDQHAGVHLPAGRAAAIAADDWAAVDGLEEHLHRRYRQVKDEARRRNRAAGGVLEIRELGFRNGARSLREGNGETERTPDPWRPSWLLQEGDDTTALAAEWRRQPAWLRPHLAVYWLHDPAARRPRRARWLLRCGLGELARRPDGPARRRLAAILASQAGDRERARRMLSAVLAAEEWPVSFRLADGLSALVRLAPDDPQRAPLRRRLLELFARRACDSDLQRYQYASLLREEGRTTEAVRRFRRLARAGGDRRLQAGACFHLGAMLGSVRWLRQCLQLEPGHRQAAHLLRELESGGAGE